MDFETADRISSTFGLYAGILAFLIPVALWWCSRHFWHPESRASYALQCALWPVIFLSYQLGGPIVRILMGLPTPPFAQTLGEKIMGIFGAFAVLGPVFFLIGYAVSKKKFPERKNSVESSSENKTETKK